MEYEAFRKARSRRLGKPAIRATSTDGGEAQSADDTGEVRVTEEKKVTTQPRQQTGRSTYKVPAGSTCNYCKKPGHWKKECRKRLKNEALKAAKSTAGQTGIGKLRVADAGVQALASKEEGTTTEHGYRRVLNNSTHDGLFVPIVFNNVTANCLIDTGSTISILHPEKYLAIPEEVRPTLQPYDEHLVMGDGGKIKPMGQAEMTFMVGDCVITHSLVIAEVEVPAVLGYDFLKASGAILDICAQKLTMNDHVIECILESRLPSLFRISLAETIRIPARSEMMTEAKLHHEWPGTFGKTPVCVETKPSFFQRTGLLVARTLVESDKELIPVRLMNASDEARIVYKNTTAAVAEPVLETKDLGQEPKDTLSGELPAHLSELFIRSTMNLSAKQKNQFKNFLFKYQDVFSKNKEDIGRTHVLQHRIKIKPGQSQSSRQPAVKREETRRQI